jgi:multiple RNA-binding domain-containing protein 1
MQVSTFPLTTSQADAVMSTVASRMGISKAELLDPTSSDAAVKQAHAETHIIQETKSYFAQHGVDLEAFQRSSKGDLAILAKNVPHGVTPDELRKMFEEHGTVTKFLMPPTGMTAIIEYSNIAEAKTAFMALSYRKMKDSILYLEKAPKDLFKEGVVVDVPRAIAVDQPGARLSATDLLADAPEPEAASTAATLYVRNLNFSTSTQLLTEAFKPLSGFRSAKVKTKVDPKRGVLSMGFGFVEFDSAETASAALRTMDGHDLEGHKLLIKASHKGADAAEERRKEDSAKKAASTKIIIKNLPFEAGVSLIYHVHFGATRTNPDCRRRTFVHCSPLTVSSAPSEYRKSSMRHRGVLDLRSSPPSAMPSTP